MNKEELEQKILLAEEDLNEARKGVIAARAVAAEKRTHLNKLLNTKHLINKLTQDEMDALHITVDAEGAISQRA